MFCTTENREVLSTNSFEFDNTLSGRSFSCIKKVMNQQNLTVLLLLRWPKKSVNRLGQLFVFCHSQNQSNHITDYLRFHYPLVLRLALHAIPCQMLAIYQGKRAWFRNLYQKIYRFYVLLTKVDWCRNHMIKIPTDEEILILFMKIETFYHKLVFQKFYYNWAVKKLVADFSKVVYHVYYGQLAH